MTNERTKLIGFHTRPENAEALRAEAQARRMSLSAYVDEIVEQRPRPRRSPSTTARRGSPETK